MLRDEQSQSCEQTQKTQAQTQAIISYTWTQAHGNLCIFYVR